MPKLTPKQKDALAEAPLFLEQSETNLNTLYYTNGNNDKWWQVRTIQILIKKGLLVRKYDRSGGHDDLWYAKK